MQESIEYEISKEKMEEMNISYVIKSWMFVLTQKATTNRSRYTFTKPV